MLQRFFPGKHIVLFHVINDYINAVTEKTELKPDALFSKYTWLWYFCQQVCEIVKSRVVKQQHRVDKYNWQVWSWRRLCRNTHSISRVLHWSLCSVHHTESTSGFARIQLLADEMCRSSYYRRVTSATYLGLFRIHLTFFHRGPPPCHSSQSCLHVITF